MKYPIAVACLFTLVLASCTDEITRPEMEGAPTSPTMSVADAASQVPFTPNGVPYRNPEYKHATGRAGLATLTARALLGRDGVTDLEVTTGDLDSSDPPPFMMTKLQLKLMGVDEEIDEVQNHNKVDAGYVAYELAGRAWHTSIQVQGNVTAPNASGKQQRTGVVTLLERVNKRPDVAVQALNGPGQVEAQTWVSLVAGVAELNGDVGARADCVLYVDGVESDRADGIWVAEHGSVYCSFVHYFSAVGTHEVEVRAENVVPGDWDPANNSATHSIEVVEVPLHGYMFGQWTKSDDDWTRDVQWVRPCTPYPGWDGCEESYDRQDESIRDELEFYGYAYARPDGWHQLAPPYGFEIIEYQDGAPAVLHALDGLTNDGCYTYWSFGSQIYLCGGASPQPYVRLERYYNREVVYWSQTSWQRTQHSWYTYCAQEDRWGRCTYWRTVHNWNSYGDEYENSYSYLYPSNAVIPPFATPWGVNIRLFGADGAEFAAEAHISSYDQYHLGGYPRTTTNCFAIYGGQDCTTQFMDRERAWGTRSF